jgi:hypothetical protein
MDGATVFIQADDGTFHGPPEERAKLIAMRLQFELDQYYPFIKDHTFRTEFVSISLEEAKAWREYNRGAKLTAEQTQLFEAMRGRLHTAITSFQQQPALTSASSSPAPATAPAPASASAEVPSVFVRLSTRSPKDAVDKLDQQTVLLPLLRKHLQRLNASSPAAASAPSASSASPAPDSKEPAAAAPDPHLVALNTQLLALRYTFFDALAMRSAEGVLQVMGMSSRVISDVSRALTAAATAGTGVVGAAPAPAPAAPQDAGKEKEKEKEQDNAQSAAALSAVVPASASSDSKSAAAAAAPAPFWHLKFIVREFVPLPLEGEFRGFVHNRQLTALSQYYCDVWFPTLTPHAAQRIGERVKQFYDTKVKQLLPMGKGLHVLWASYVYVFATNHFFLLCVGLGCV